MKHLAIQARSVNGDRPYTTPGLGDRIHSAILGWVYGQGEPVTLHLTDDKWRGGQFSNKPESWAEIVSLFPAGRLQVMHHRVSPRSEADWIDYLKGSGYEVEPYGYGDGKLNGFDISVYLRSIPLLKAEPQDMELPERFVTVQWDSNARSRTIPADRRAQIQERYGYPVVVGGEAHDERLRWSLKHIAYAMSKADGHVGGDSAFFHMAQLYMPWWKIHLYTMNPSHHALRAQANGAQVNRYL